MCSNCKDIILREQFYSPQDYCNCLSYISQLIAGGFQMAAQTCPIDEVKRPDGCWYADVIDHKIQCKCCGECFVASVDTYHGGGAFTTVI